MLGVGTLVVILLLQGSKRVPGILIAVVGATAIVATLDLADALRRGGLGSLPQGLPGFVVPWISYGDIVPVLIGGCAIALVSFADTSVLSRAYAARMGARVSIPTRRWWGSAPPIWRLDFSRLPDQQQHFAYLPWPKPPAPVPN